MGKMVGKITLDMNEALLTSHLEKYKDRALEWGATKAKIIRTQDIVLDERIPLKCQIPRCFGYGTGAHCPPNTLKPA